MASEMTSETLVEWQIHCQCQLGSRVRHLRLIPCEGGVTLTGYCRTYHAKQLAQHIVGETTGLRVVANEIDVVS
jgi:hypothetical protein